MLILLDGRKLHASVGLAEWAMEHSNNVIKIAPAVSTKEVNSIYLARHQNVHVSVAVKVMCFSCQKTTLGYNYLS